MGAILHTFECSPSLSLSDARTVDAGAGAPRGDPASFAPRGDPATFDADGSGVLPIEQMMVAMSTLDRVNGQYFIATFVDGAALTDDAASAAAQPPPTVTHVFTSAADAEAGARGGGRGALLACRALDVRHGRCESEADTSVMREYLLREMSGGGRGGTLGLAHLDEVARDDVSRKDWAS